MTNSEIVDVIELSGKLLELHDKDANRAKLYGSLAYNLDRYEGNLAELPKNELQKIRGVGQAMSSTISEIIENGTTEELENLIAYTPEGVLEMFKVKGIGVKKIKQLWNELGIDNLNELRIACENGKIAQTKGFGEKTQVSILESLAFLQAQAGKLRINKAHELANEILADLKTLGFDAKICGQVVRNNETVDKISFLIFEALKEKNKLPESFIENYQFSSPNIWRGNYANEKVEIELIFVHKEDEIKETLINNSSVFHLAFKNERNESFYKVINSATYNAEESIYASFGSKWIVPEMREGLQEFEWIKTHDNTDLISWEDLKGSVHNHSTYSDGAFSLKDMADFCQNLGLEYFGIADHSQTATYASGLSPGRLIQQMEEIDKLNADYEGFRILKGTESDILGDGSLDYDSEILKQLDYVVASVHANLNMDLEKATSRIIRAVENEYTTILGHPTGRLLLSRKGYPLDFKKVIDACAANEVIMEINASPYRLDLDWRWIAYCLEKGVKLSINPDAHHTNGFADMKWGVAVARKGGLTKDMTFNALGLKEITSYLNIV